MGQVARLHRQPGQRDPHQLWPAQRRLRQWRDPPHRRSVQLPRRSVQPSPRMRRRGSSPRRARPHRILQRHDPRSIAPRRRNDQP
jgi:hypothetical protein